MSDFVYFVKNMAQDAKEDRFAISVISSFLSSVGTGSSGDLDALLRTWQADMILSGIKASTRKRYFSRLHTIYSQWPGAGTDDPFSISGSISGNISGNTSADGTADDYAAMAMADANLDIAKRLALKSVDSRPNEYLNVFFYLLYDIEASLTDAINLRFDDPTPRLSQVDDLVDAMRGSKHRKYVFNLNRGAKRFTQVSRELIAGMDTELTK